jgi:hypothetical protein
MASPVIGSTEDSIDLMVFLNLIMGRHQTSPDGGMVYKISVPQASSQSKS